MKKLLTVFVALALLAGTAFAAPAPTLEFGASGEAGTSLFSLTKNDGKVSNKDDSVTFGTFHNGAVTNGGTSTLKGGFSVTLKYANDNGSGQIKFATGDLPGVTTLGNIALDSWSFSGTVGKFNGKINGGFDTKALFGGGDARIWKLAPGTASYFAENKIIDGQNFVIGFTPNDSFKIQLGTKTKAFPTNNGDYSTSGINAYALLSLINIADLVTVDLFYGIDGSSTNTKFNDLTTPAGNWDNLFGVYSGIAVGDLTVKFGYSASVKVNQPYTTTDFKKTITVTDPFYSGIDLKVNFKGIDKVEIDFNNNISFAGATGSKTADTDKEITALFGTALGENHTQNYFSYRGELSGKYTVTDALSFKLTLSEKLGTTSDISKTGDITTTNTTTNNIFGVNLTATYKVGPVTLGSGLEFSVDAFDGLSKTSDSSLKDSLTLNTTTFKVPVTFKVEL